MGSEGRVASSALCISISETSPVTTSPEVEVSSAAALLSVADPDCNAEPLGMSCSSVDRGLNSRLALIPNAAIPDSERMKTIAMVQAGNPNFSNTPDRPPEFDFLALLISTSMEASVIET